MRGVVQGHPRVLFILFSSRSACDGRGRVGGGDKFASLW